MLKLNSCPPLKSVSVTEICTYMKTFQLTYMKTISRHIVWQGEVRRLRSGLEHWIIDKSANGMLSEPLCVNKFSSSTECQWFVSPAKPRPTLPAPCVPIGQHLSMKAVVSAYICVLSPFLLSIKGTVSSYFINVCNFVFLDIFKIFFLTLGNSFMMAPASFWIF